jgi:hypothetical protein
MFTWTVTLEDAYDGLTDGAVLSFRLMVKSVTFAVCAVNLRTGGLDVAIIVVVVDDVAMSVSLLAGRLVVAGWSSELDVSMLGFRTCLRLWLSIWKLSGPFTW